MSENEVLRTALLQIRKIRRNKTIPDHELDPIYNIAMNALNFEEKEILCPECKIQILDKNGRWFECNECGYTEEICNI